MGYTALVFSELALEAGKRLLATCFLAETRQFLNLEPAEASKQR